MSLIEELIADQDPRAVCRACAWIAAQTPKDQADWDRVMADRARFTHASVFRALVRRDAAVSRGSVENHRVGGHRKPRP